MLLEDINLKYTREIPESFQNLNFLPYITQNYRFYKKPQVASICCELFYNLINRYKQNFHNKHNKKRDQIFILVYRTKSKYPIHDYSHDVLWRAIDVLEDLNIITVIIGTRFTVKTDETSKAVSLMTKLVLNKSKQWLINEICSSIWKFTLSVFCHKMNKKHDAVIRTKLYDKNGARILQNNRQQFKDSLINKSSDIFKEVKYINTYLIQRNIKTLRYQRIFNDNKYTCGRLYSSFQRIPKELREKICNEKGWIELDFCSFLPNLLYKIKAGKEFKNDPYKEVITDIIKQGNELPYCFRPLIKKAFMSVLSVKSRAKALQSIQYLLAVKAGMYSSDKGGVYVNELKEDEDHPYNKFIENNDIETDAHYRINPEFLLSTIELTHKEILGFFYTEFYKISQFIESNTIVRLLHEMIDNEILPLSIHDSIIVPIEHSDHFKHRMQVVLDEEIDLFKKDNSIDDLINKDNFLISEKKEDKTIESSDGFNLSDMPF